MSNNLREWLGQLGLGAYAELLEAHAVDFDVLPEVTEGDLEKLGITLGHRKKLLRAIRELDFSQQRAEPTALREPAARPERRQLTVLICDLVDSTGMSRRHDPEDLSVILAEYQRCCEDVINRFHGTIARFMGDGVFCYFGYPQADEIDAERSIRAGLEIVSQLDQLRPLGVTLEVRVGIATGLVVIGETIGEGMAREQAVRGETPNLASRLMSLAEPGTLVVAEATRRLALPLFEFIDLGEHRLKGFEHEIRAWRVAGATAVQSRSEALHARVDLTALVGREEEVALAHRRWQQALSGAGQVLLISGEPGIGKSRLARLDRLGPVKQVAQMASAFGRQCSFGLLAAVSQLSDEQLQDALDQLSAAEVIHAGTGDRRSIYTFKHALLQDAAYSSMLRADKQQLHARIAEVLEDSYPEQVEYEPELVAHHCAGAGLSERAVGYWQKAGERAIRQSASAEAVDHLTKALALLETLPESRRRTEQELALQTSLGPALAASHGFSALDVEAAYARALALSRDVGDTTTTSTVQRGLWAYHFVRADLRAARELGDQLLELGRQEGDEGVLLESHRVLGQTLLCAGAFSEARDHLEQGIALYDPELHSAHSFVYGNDPGIVCASYRAYALWFLGRPSEARRQSDDVLVRARALGHPFSLAFALVMATYLRQHLGDVPGTRELADEGIAVTSQQGYPFWAHVETMLKGWTDAEQGDVEKGISQLRQGLNAYLALGSSLMCPMFLGLLAEACARAQRYEDGLEALDEAIDRVAQTGERFRLAELHRLKGELLLRRDGSAAAEAAEDCFQNALDIARQQQALAWELRTAVSRARLWRSGRQARDAATQLRQVYERFDQGFDTADLSAARGLLAALAQA